MCIFCSVFCFVVDRHRFFFFFQDFLRRSSRTVERALGETAALDVLLDYAADEGDNNRGDQGQHLNEAMSLHEVRVGICRLTQVVSSCPNAEPCIVKAMCFGARASRAMLQQLEHRLRRSGRNSSC